MEIGFGQWMLVGVPIAVVLLFACWFLLTRVLFRPEIDEVPGGRDLIATELARLEFLFGLYQQRSAPLAPAGPAKAAGRKARA